MDATRDVRELTKGCVQHVLFNANIGVNLHVDQVVMVNACKRVKAVVEKVQLLIMIQ